MKKNAIKALEGLRDWNKGCSEDFMQYASDHDLHLAKSVAHIFETNHKILTEIIKELKPKKK